MPRYENLKQEGLVAGAEKAEVGMGRGVLIQREMERYIGA